MELLADTPNKLYYFPTSNLATGCKGNIPIIRALSGVPGKDRPFATLQAF